MLINSSLGRVALDYSCTINRFHQKSKQTNVVRIQERFGTIATAKCFSKLLNLGL